MRRFAGYRSPCASPPKRRAKSGEAGDPLDVMVLMGEPAHVGCMLDVRTVGVIEAEQTQDGKTQSNCRVLAVAVRSYSHENIAPSSHMSQSVLDQLEQFFISYNKLHGKKFKVTGGGGPKRALTIVKNGMKAFDKKNG